MYSYVIPYVPRMFLFYIYYTYIVYIFLLFASRCVCTVQASFRRRIPVFYLVPRVAKYICFGMFLYFLTLNLTMDSPIKGIVASAFLSV